MTAEFWRDVAERAVKTFAQALLAMLTVGSVLTDIDWPSALGMAGTAALASVLSSIISAGFGDPESASLLSGSDNDPSDGRHSE